MKKSGGFERSPHYTGLRMALMNVPHGIAAFEQACLQAGEEGLLEKIQTFAQSRVLPIAGEGWVGRALALAALEHPDLNPPVKAGRPSKRFPRDILNRCHQRYRLVETVHSYGRAYGVKLSDRKACLLLLRIFSKFDETSQPFQAEWKQWCNDVSRVRTSLRRTAGNK